MKSVSGKDLAHALERNGWELLRVQGSHHIYGKPGKAARLSVPIHAGTGQKRDSFITCLTLPPSSPCSALAAGYYWGPRGEPQTEEVYHRTRSK